MSKLPMLDKENCFTWKRYFKRVFMLQYIRFSFLDDQLLCTDFSAKLILKYGERYSVFPAMGNKQRITSVPLG